ncbi:uncharacterized protein LOC123506982 isoform X2 [Portunus trituberculatus]|uniref:uncharacterized protein LOC123506982 isoform X2 n=1 Tax=Portunus trituberculatus TaxID=210409 RepID=UPI001E1D0C73|nr:uncharacterized protein LOC123506982 isoform X2 [Portunus trituberculatus]
MAYHQGRVVVDGRVSYATMGESEERIVMTPRGKTANSTTIMVERRKVVSQEGNVHVGGGQHSGIIINKEARPDVEDTAAHLQLEFKVFLVNAQTQKHTQESRQLRFWFLSHVPEKERMRSAQEFFKELVAPLEFPRDYVGFIKKIMKMMQHKYKMISKVEVELKQLEESDSPPTRPTRAGAALYTVGCSEPDAVEDQTPTLSEEKILEMIESSYPNPITVQEMAKRASSTVEQVKEFIAKLAEKGLIKAMTTDCYTRVVQNETDVKVVRQMPTITSKKQPTIAIITAHYCEKLAVDTMIENQETFVRYTTVGGSYGESNIYTLGNIGAHRVVCTKLPTVGHDRSASIAAGNTTTRLLGTFQKVDHVFLVGTAGGVPHYTDYNKHVRLGDVVVATPPAGQKFIYMYCEGSKILENGSYEFETKSWGPPDLSLQNIAYQLQQQGIEKNGPMPWIEYMEAGNTKLQEQEMDFSRPNESTDKLYMSIGGSDVIEVSHPLPPEGSENVRDPTKPRVHLGVVAAGRSVVDNDQMRQDFASQLSVVAYDQEFDAVVESVYGNRKDQYVFIRGICDYKDGTRNKDWQPYAALVAAAFMKAVICGMEPPADD